MNLRSNGLKAHEWLTSNKAKIETGHRTFDNQCCAVFYGACSSDTQQSGYVRPYNAEHINGVGHLQQYDLSLWRSLPTDVRNCVSKYGEEQYLIIYEFHHWNGNRKIVHGYVVTDQAHHPLLKKVTGPTYKSYDVINWVLPYICFEY